MDCPTDRRYLASHEWHKLDGDVCTIGITKFAADQLTDITYVDLPAVGTAVTAGKAFGEIESVKATGDLVSGVPGQITAVNASLRETPEVVNNDPYGDGWMVKVKVADKTAFERLMTAEAYQAKLGR